MPICFKCAQHKSRIDCLKKELASSEESQVKMRDHLDGAKREIRDMQAAINRLQIQIKKHLSKSEIKRLEETGVVQ